MRELERETDNTNPRLPALTIVGAGRVGGSLAAAAERTGLPVEIAGREGVDRAEAVLLCVPDSEVEAACGELMAASPRFVGHVSGALGLSALATVKAAGAETFTLHPLQTFADAATAVDGVPCAISGSSPEALAFARSLAEALGLDPFELDDEQRAAYHAAASIASNFLVTLEEAASGLLDRVGVEDGRALLAPLVLRTASNWAESGADALTGPIARGDEATVARHLDAIAELNPELLDAYRAMAGLTRELAARKVPA